MKDFISSKAVLLILTLCIPMSTSMVIKFHHLFNRFSQKISLRTKSIIDYPKLTYQNLTEQDKYDLQWYVIGTPLDFPINVPQKATIWNKNYVVWQNEKGEYTALDDACPHKGASLAGGVIQNGSVVCPYHGYEFDCAGELTKVPGICFQPSTVYNVPKYNIVEKNGWVYLNTFSDLIKNSSLKDGVVGSELEELNLKRSMIASRETIGFPTEDEVGRNDSVVFLDMDFDCYSRILSENSLDVMHIGFVHTFGNKERPAPIEVHPPRLVGPHHFKTTYMYEAGENSLARRYFKIKDLIIENEFILPHTTVARVIFGDYVSTVITFALPISENKSRLFVKTYRNFWKNPMGDKISRDMMYQTMLQDRVIVENIHPHFEDGKFNMRFDKLQNTYKTFYKRFIHRKRT